MKVIILGIAVVVAFGSGVLAAHWVSFPAPVFAQQPEQSMGSIPKAWGRLVAVNPDARDGRLSKMFFEASDGTIRTFTAETYEPNVRRWERK